MEISLYSVNINIKLIQYLISFYVGGYTLNKLPFCTNMIENDKPFFPFYIKECMPGYYDINCSKTCEYPSFGKRCLQKCSCEKDLCNFMSGCKKSKYIHQYTSAHVYTLQLFKKKLLLLVTI